MKASQASTPLIFKEFLRQVGGNILFSLCRQRKQTHVGQYLINKHQACGNIPLLSTPTLSVQVLSLLRFQFLSPVQLPVYQVSKKAV